MNTYEVTYTLWNQEEKTVVETVGADYFSSYEHFPVSFYLEAQGNPPKRRENTFGYMYGALADNPEDTRPYKPAELVARYSNVVKVVKVG